jgi:rare lipoprotein A
MIVTGTSPVIIESTNTLAALGPVAAPATVAAPQPTAAPAVAAPQIRQDPIQVFVAPPAEPEARIPPESQIPSIAEPAPAGNAYNYTANIIGGIPRPDTGKHYRLQVGAYRIPRNAVEACDRLKEVGLNPAYEVNGDIYRVVLAWLDPKDIPAIAEKLYSAGFWEAVIREER